MPGVLALLSVAHLLFAARSEGECLQQPMQRCGDAKISTGSQGNTGGAFPLMTACMQSGLHRTSSQEKIANTLKRKRVLPQDHMAPIEYRQSCLGYLLKQRDLVCQRRHIVVPSTADIGGHGELR
jgi:hypothetical protein